MTASPPPADELAGVIHALTDAVTSRAAADAAHEQACTVVLGMVRRLRAAAQSSYEPAFLAVVRHLYWQQPTVPGWDLAGAAGFTSPTELTKAIGSIPSGIICEGCQREMRRTSRTWQPPERHDGLQLCRECGQQRRDHRQRVWRIRSLRHHHVDSAPVTAWATDWLVATTLVLAYPPLTIGWSREDAERNGLWRGYDQAQLVAQHLAGYPRDAEVSVEARTGLDVVCTAEEVAAWDPGRTCALTETVTDEAVTVVLTRLRRRVRAVVEQRTAEAEQRFPDDYVPAEPVIIPRR